MKAIKRLATLVLSLALLLAMMPTGGIVASAQSTGSGQCGDTAYWDITDNVLTISGTGPIYHYDYIGDYIPDYAAYASSIRQIVIEDGITEIGNEAFESFDDYGDEFVYSSLTEIRIPNTVNKIGVNAFAGSTSIETIHLPASVDTLGIQAFSHCSALTNITVEAGNTAFASIGGVLYTADGTGLIAYPIGRTVPEYTIPSSVKTIWPCAFVCEEDLQKVYFNEGLEVIGDAAFNSCYNLNEVYLPSTLKVIAGDSFQCCTSLSDFTIPRTIESIGAYSFLDTAYYFDRNNWSDGVLYYENILLCSKYMFDDIFEIFEGSCTVRPGTTLIANEAFIFTDLTDVSLPNTLKRIGDGAFYCTLLESVDIPDSVESIGDEAFRSCSDLASVQLGDNITHIGSGAFNETAYAKDSANYTNGLLCNGQYLLDFQTDLTGTAVIPEGITLLADGAFFYESGVISENKGSLISSVTFPSTLTAISAKAFLDCKNLKELTIPNTITAIGDYAFGYYHSYDYSEEKTKYLPLTDVSIACGKDTAADRYATANGIACSYFAESIRLSEPEYTLYAGRDMTCQLTTTFLPDGSAVEAVTYRSSDEDIATVNADGLVTIHNKAGTVTITATTASGFTDTVELTVCSLSLIEAETPHTISFSCADDVQYFRFKSGNAGIYNFNYETDSVATALYTVTANTLYADIPSGSFSVSLPANTLFELRVRCNPYVAEETLTVVPPASGGDIGGGDDDSPRLTADDVESIEVYPIKMFENTYGKWLTYYDEEADEEHSYYCYEWESFVGYRIELKNGDTIDAPEGYFTYDDILYQGASAHAHKQYEDRWLVDNTYTEQVTVLGIECDVSITIEKPPIKSIRCSVDEVTILEGTYCDILTNSTVSTTLYEYRWYEAVDWIVEFQDGSEQTAFNGLITIEGRHYSFDFSDTQGTLQSWTVGNTYPAHAKFMGLECEIEVTISASIIKDIVFHDIYVYEHADGYFSLYHDDDWQPVEWFRYNWQQFLDYDVTFVDGIVAEDWGDGFYYDGTHYGIEKYDTQTKYSPWVAGTTYDVEVAVFGQQYDVKVTVLPNPVAEITFENIVIPQGYGSTETEYDALLNENFTYFKYDDHAFAYSVRFKDGSYIPGATDGIEYDGREYSPMIVGGMQTHSNVWEPGSAHQITVRVMGVDTIVPVYIQPIPAAEGLGYQYNYRGNISITECSKTDTRLVIPAEIGERVVTEILSLDIAEDVVEELVLPRTITELGRFDFKKMENLKTIYYAGSRYEWEDISHFYSGYGDIDIVYNYKTSLPQAVRPICQSVTTNSVTLAAVDGCEYSIDGIHWQTSPVFSDLSPATEYVFYQRYAATGSLTAGEMSIALTVKTHCPHLYDHACDKSCNICGATRSVSPHVYSHACDRSCNICGATRTVGAHKYTNSCDTTCNNCGATRMIIHTFRTTTTKATLTANGATVKQCTVCDKVASNTPIARPRTFTLSTTAYTYDGGVKTPSVTVKDTAGKTLTKNTDYTVTYASGRTNVGTYKVTVEMIGKYSGTKVLYFKINPISATKCKFTLSTTAYTYNGKAKAPTVTVKDAAGKVLKKNTDYTVTYAGDRTNVGTYKVTVKMIGKYSGTKVLTFKINPAKLSSYRLSATSYIYNGSIKTPAVTVKNSSGKVLKKNTDYTVTYASGRKNVGTYKVTIKGKGNYTGTKTLTFKIIPAKTTVSKLTAGKKSITVAITKKTAQVTGYQIQYSTSKAFSKATTKTIASYKTTKYTLKGLSAKKVYYVRVRTYKKVGSTTYYSGWSTYKYIKTK